MHDRILHRRRPKVDFNTHLPRGVATRFIHSRITTKHTVVPTGVGRPRSRPVVVNHGFLMGIGTGVNGSTIASSVRRRIRGLM